MSGKGSGRGISSWTVRFAIFSGIGVVSLLYLFRKLLTKKPPNAISTAKCAVVSSSSCQHRPESSGTSRQTPSDRGLMPPSSSIRPPRIRHPTISSTVPPLESDLVAGLETCQELARSLERACTNLSLVKNRSDKDRNRADMVQSVLDRLKLLETDIGRLVQEGGLVQGEGDDGSATSGWVGYQSPRAGTLSVLSDDSFISAFEDFQCAIDEDGEIEIDKSNLFFYQLGIEKATAGEVLYRKPRTEFCQCESETEFAAKVYCLRQAFELVLQDEHRRLWLTKSGRQLLGDILKHSKQDVSPFYKSFDEMMDFLSKEQHFGIISEELSARGVVQVSFWDVVLDFILLDSFDDLKSPPSAVYSVTRNFFLSQSMKYSTISTIIWSMLKQKRTRLQHTDGFIAHFYNISETVSPAITLGFLGTDDIVRDLCIYFKEQMQGFVVDIFNPRKVRFTSVQELADDVWVQMESRTELILTRLSSELIPA